MGRFLAGLIILAASCRATEGDLVLTVEWERPPSTFACVTLDAEDPAGPSRRERRTLPLAVEDGTSGSLVVGILPPEGWSSRMTLTVALRLDGCDTSAAASERLDITFERNVHRERTVRLVAMAPDGGVPVPDAGPPDSGVPDAGGPDAGVPDAGAPDAGVPDAGTPDAGLADAGSPDAGPPDAGPPLDAGPPCTDGLRVLALGKDWTDVVVYNRAQAQILAVSGVDSIQLVSPNGASVEWGGGTCTGDFRAAWLSPRSGLVYLASTDAVRIVRQQATCDLLASFAPAQVSSLTGVDLDDGGVQLFVGSLTTPFIREVAQDGMVSDALVPGARQVDDLSAAGPGSVFAAGGTFNGNKGIIWRRTSQGDWETAGESPAGNTPFTSIEVPAAGFGAAAGRGTSQGSLSIFDGNAWVDRPGPPFVPRGVHGRAPDQVYVVGAPQGGMLSFARWDGTGWTVPTSAVVTDGGILRRLRGSTGCAIWAVGDGVIATTLP